MERDLLLVATVEVGLLTLVINLRIASPRITFLPVNSSSYNKTLSRDFVVSWLMTVLFYAIMVCCYCYQGSHQKIGKIQDLVLNKGWRVRESKFLCFFGNHFFLLKTSKNAMKHVILSSKMKGDVISDHFLMLWFQKDSLTGCHSAFSFRQVLTSRVDPGC